MSAAYPRALSAGHLVLARRASEAIDVVLALCSERGLARGRVILRKALLPTLPLGLALAGGDVAAQIATDGSVGPRVELSGPEFAVGADLGTRAGDNLFHSFERFSLSAGERATFTGPDDLRNVISRVTGGARSSIDGTLRSEIAGADFYFINPAGVLFGPNASLDVPGSFHVSTADELRFPGDEVFSASDPDASSFSFAAPEAFGFLGAEPADITVDRSTLEVPAGEGLSLVGGNILVDQAVVRAEAGTVNVVGVGGPGTVGVADAETTGGQLADITLTNGAQIDSSGNGGGTVSIRGGKLVIQNQSSVSADNTGSIAPRGLISIAADRLVVRDLGAVLSIARAGGDAVPITVEAGRIFVSGSGTSRVTGIASQTAEGSIGNAGAVTIVADHLILEGGDAQINADTFGEGDGGPIMVTADRIEIRGDGRDPPAAITSSAQRANSGSSGSIRVEADTLLLTNGGRIQTQTFGQGPAGSIELFAGSIVLDSDGVGLPSAVDSSTRGEGRGGNLYVRTSDLRITGGGLLATAFGGGLSGTVDIESDMVFLGPAGVIASGSVSQIPGLISGRGGSVRIDAGIVTMRGQPDTPAGIFTATLGGQDAGRIEIIADELRMSNAGIAATTLADTGAGPIRIMVDRLRMSSSQIQSASLFGRGNGGRIVIRADQEMVLTGSPAALSLIATVSSAGGDAGNIRIVSPRISLESSSITSAAAGQGDAGAVTIEARDELVLDRAEISTAALQAAGGQITLQVGRLIDLRKSSIASSVAQDAGNAGDISIDPHFLILDDSQILARAVAGRGGDIRIVADNLVLSPDSLINAEAGEAGVDGTVATSEPAVDLASALVVLAAPLLDADALLREPCALRQDVGASSFTGAGRGGLPPAPDRPLGSAYRPPAEAQAAPGDASVRPAALTLALPCSNPD